MSAAAQEVIATPGAAVSSVGWRQRSWSVHAEARTVPARSSRRSMVAGGLPGQQVNHLSGSPTSPNKPTGEDKLPGGGQGCLSSRNTGQRK